MPTRGDTTRHVVWLPSDFSWELEPALDRPCSGGGARTMHELAVAIAVTGRTVEVRGAFDLSELDRLGHAAGAHPETPGQSRALNANDVLLTPEGWPDPLTYAPAVLSGARLIMVVLAPPGLFGWPFVDAWTGSAPATTALGDLATAEQIRAITETGFDLWTHMPHFAERASAAGVSCRFIGNGRPLPYPDPPPKHYDVATLQHSRWREEARSVAERLPDSITWRELPRADNDELLRGIGAARILIHPLRIEGHSRIGQEARALGTVPVVLDTNPFAVGLDESRGAVAVSDLAAMPRAVQALLDDPARLRELSARGIRSARTQTDWKQYVARVDAALAARASHNATRGARAEIGRRLREHNERRLEAELRSRQERAQLETQRDELVASVQQLTANQEALTVALSAEQQQLKALRATRAIRIATAYWRARDHVRDRRGRRSNQP